MTKTLDEYFQGHQALKLLIRNLKANEDVFLKEMSVLNKESLMRCNLIMIRQCLEDFGVE